MKPFVWHKFIKGKKTCMIFLHGLTGSSSAWIYTYPYFEKKGHSILLIDIRGHGLSDKPEDHKEYSLYKIAEDVKEIMDQHKVKKAIFVGHCYGAMATMAFYDKHPEMVEKMIFISTNYEFSSNKVRAVLSRIVYFLYWLVSLFAKPFHLERNKVHLNYDPFRGGHDFDPKRIYHDVRVTSFRTFLALFREGFSLDFTDVLKKIDVPVLIMHGKKDLVFPYKAAERMHENIKGSKLIPLDTNHISVLSVPDDIKKHIEEFI